VLLRDLAGMPELRLRVLVGEDALDRVLDGVFTTDLLDPRRYLTGGEIVLTGLMWRRSPADSEVFVAMVVAAGAVALAAGDAAFGSVPGDLVDACRRHGMPLLEVPVDVSFAAITERVLAARLGPAGPGAAWPGAAVARLRALASGLAGTAERGPGEAAAERLAAVFAVAAREYGVAGWVMSATGRLVAGVRPAPGPALAPALTGAWLGAADLPVTVMADGAPYSLFGVAGQPGHHLARWFVALAGDQAAWDGDRRAIAAELAAVAAGHRARHEEGRRAARRAADAALPRLLDRGPGAGEAEGHEIAAALRHCGLPSSGPLVAVALTAGPAHAETARVLLEEMLPGAVAGACGAEALALAPGGEETAGRLRDAVGALTRAYANGALAFGVSVLRGAAGEDAPPAAGGHRGNGAAGAPGAGGSGTGGPRPGGFGAGSGDGWTVAGACRAVAEARQAGRLAALLGGGVRLVDAAQFGSVGLLLATVPGEARRAFRASLLDPLLAYDRDHGTELVRTLRVFLDCSGSWTRAADAMFVHVNSLRYRIGRVEDLTGRDLSSLADQAALLLALRLSDSAEDQGTDPFDGGGVEAGQLTAG
jgi:hypothetical protein